MSIEWAGWSSEPLVRLDRARPLRVQPESSLWEAIRSGRLSPGERLSSSRAMAARLGVPDLASFPRADWAWAQREAARTVRTAELSSSSRVVRDASRVLARWTMCCSGR